MEVLLSVRGGPALRGVAILALVALASCDFKKEDLFFLLGPGGVVDVDAPEFFDPQPASNVDVLNTDTYMIGVRDPSTNGTASGLDPSTLSADDAMPLPATLSGDMATIDVSGLSDGTHTVLVGIYDQAGNYGSYTIGPKVFDRTAPAFDFTTSAPSDFSTDATTWDLSVGYSISDPHFLSATIGLYEPGGDEACGTDDDVGFTPTSQGGHVDNPSVETTSTGAGSTTFHVNNPVSVGGMSQRIGYCVGQWSLDAAVDKTGAANPNTSWSTISTTPFYVTYVSPPPPTAIQVTVLDDQGTGIGGVAVTISGGGQGTTDASGKVTIAVTPGSHDVSIGSVEGHFCPETSKSVSVSQGQTATTTFTCDRNGSLSGTVTLDGGPAVGFTVQLDSRTTTTDAQGHYAFSNLAPGTYTVRVNPPTDVFCDPSGTNIAVPPGGSNTADFTCTTQQGPPMTGQLFGVYASTLTRTSASGPCTPPISGNNNTMVTGDANTNQVSVDNLDPVVGTITGAYDPSTGNYGASGSGQINGIDVNSSVQGNFSVMNGTLWFSGTLTRIHVQASCSEFYDLDMNFLGTSGSY